MPASELTARRKADEKPKEILNDGWVRYFDEESQYHYYWNEGTQESTYDRPSGFQTVANPFATINGTKKTLVPPQLLTARRKESQKPTEKLNGGWVKYKDPDSGYDYYYHEEMNTSTYERPTDFIATVQNPFGTVNGDKAQIPSGVLSCRRDDGQKPAEILNFGFVKYIDPETNYPYYYNEREDYSTYDRPEGFVTQIDPFATLGSRLRRSNIPNMQQTVMEDDIMNTGGSDELSMMMATFARNEDAMNTRLGRTGTNALTSLQEEGGGADNPSTRRSSIGAAGSKLLGGNDILDKVNSKLNNMSLEELKRLRDGDGIMSTLRDRMEGVDVANDQQYGNSKPFIPQLKFGGFGNSITASASTSASASASASASNVANQSSGGAQVDSSGMDALDVITQQSSIVGNVSETRSWMDLADEGQTLTGNTGAADQSGQGDDEDEEDDSEWVEYFDDEVQSSYYYNTLTGEASWVKPT